MLIDVHQGELSSSLVPDVIIVGAGAVGLCMAMDLVKRGLSVIVLEAGPLRIEKTSQEFFEAATWHGYPLEGLHVGRNRVLGGTTTSWAGQLLPFDPIVFTHRPWVSDVTWPIERATLEPYYERAFDSLGMQQRVSDDQVWQSLKTPVPQPGEDLDVILTRWTPEPEFAVLFKKEIAHNPKLHVVINAAVTGVSLAKDAQTIEQVVVRRIDGTTQPLKARQIVLANGTIEIARLLSLPLADGAPAPWSDNPHLACGFSDHVDAYAGSLALIDKARFHDLFDNIMLRGIKYSPRIKLSEFAQRREQLLGISAQFLFQSKYKSELDKVKAPMKALLHGKLDKRLLAIPGLFLPMARIAAPMASRYLMHKRVYNPTDGGIDLRISSEQMPLKRSRLTLRGERDALDMPLVDVEWQIDTLQIETMARFCEIISAYLERERLAHVKLNPRLVARDPAFLSEVDDANHQMGMARMGSSPEGGVVDPDLRVFGSNNLYVAGAAVFPTTGFANPTLTAIALGLRLADHLVATIATDGRSRQC